MLRGLVRGPGLERLFVYDDASQITKFSSCNWMRRQCFVVTFWLIGVYGYGHPRPSGPDSFSRVNCVAYSQRLLATGCRFLSLLSHSPMLPKPDVHFSGPKLSVAFRPIPPLSSCPFYGWRLVLSLIPMLPPIPCWNWWWYISTSFHRHLGVI